MTPSAPRGIVALRAGRACARGGAAKDAKDAKQRSGCASRGQREGTRWCCSVDVDLGLDPNLDLDGDVDHDPTLDLDTLDLAP